MEVVAPTRCVLLLTFVLVYKDGLEKTARKVKLLPKY